MARIFISYRRTDSEGYTGRLYDRLLKFYEKSQIFLDVEALEAGADFESVIMSELDACEVFIPIIGPRWVDVEDSAGDRRLANPADYVRREVAGALQRDKTIIPVLVNRAQMPKKKELPKDMRGLCRFNAAELSHGGFDDDVKRLVKSSGGGYGRVGVYVPRGWSSSKFAEVVIHIKIDEEEESAARWLRRMTPSHSDSILAASHKASGRLRFWTLSPSLFREICVKELEAGQHTISARFRSSSMSPDRISAAERILGPHYDLSTVRVPREVVEKPGSRPRTHHDRVSFKLKAGEFAKFTFDCRLRTRGEGQYYKYSIERM